MMNGILLIDKPQNFTSFDVVAKLRGMLNQKKIGHTGTLDPMATGVLVILLGKATKLCNLIPQQDKRYTVTFQLGLTTTTQDITGEVLEQKDFSFVTPQLLKQAVMHFQGTQQQTVPAYSAVKINGQKLCNLARKQLVTACPAHSVTVYELNLQTEDYKNGVFTLDVFCSKGTYVRTICHDIGQYLGCGAAVTSLRRTMANGFLLNQCITLQTLQQNLKDSSSYLLPIDSVFAGCEKVILDSYRTKLYCNGVPLDLKKITCPNTTAPLAVYSDKNKFLGLSKIDKQFEQLKLIQLFAQTETL